MPSQAELIKGCEARDPHLMEQFYKQFAPEMWVVCLRYTRNVMTAEDVMQEGFIRAFDSIGSYSGKGSLSGWLRRVFITTAINHFRKYYQNDKQESEIDNVGMQIPAIEEDAISKINREQLLGLLNQLPDGYRMVFNLYAIEGYSHSEVATMLGCSEVTSRSQLSRARIFLQQLVQKLEEPSYARQQNFRKSGVKL